MKIFVSGATGFIGARIAQRLASAGHTVHALYRSESKLDPIRQQNIRLFKGDILDSGSILKAMEGCDQAYHVAAFAGVWSKDPEIIFRLNVDGALKVVSCAGECGLSRVVLTSTAGILGPSTGDPVHEDSPPPSSFFTPYEASKQKMEEAIDSLPAGGPEVVIVNPTRVYGPGLLSESNGVTRMIGRYVEGKWKLLPGDGKSSGNYVFVEDVVDGHLLAMENGRDRERYVLGGENISYLELFAMTREISGKNYKLYRVPLWLMLSVAGIMKFITLLTGKAPLIVPGLVRKFNHQWIVSSDKARMELGYAPIGAREGIARTLEWISSTEQNTCT